MTEQEAIARIEVSVCNDANFVRTDYPIPGKRWTADLYQSGEVAFTSLLMDGIVSKIIKSPMVDLIYEPFRGHIKYVRGSASELIALAKG